MKGFHILQKKLKKIIKTYWQFENRWYNISCSLRNCVRVAQQTLTLFVWVRILVPQPKNRQSSTEGCRFFYPIRRVGISSHRRCVFCRLDDMQHFALIFPLSAKSLTFFCIIIKSFHIFFTYKRLSAIMTMYVYTYKNTRRCTKWKSLFQFFLR